MARNPDLIRTILDRRSDDTARLVYADWLDENDDPKHAELIRVQCELANKSCKGKRRQILAKRETELLRDPGFHLPGRGPFRYARGFINEGCMLAFTGTSAWFHRFSLASLGDASTGWVTIDLTLADLPVLDRTLNLTLNLSALPSKRLKWDDPLLAGCLQRVTNLGCSESVIEPDPVKRLTKCPHLSGVDSITFEKAGVVPLDVISALFLAPTLPNVTALHLDGEEWWADEDTPAEDEQLAEFVTCLGASEKAAQLAYLQLNWQIGPQTAQALLDSPHLKPSDQLCLFMHKGLKKPMLTALRKKFGKALRMLI